MGHRAGEESMMDLSNLILIRLSENALVFPVAYACSALIRKFSAGAGDLIT
jgi:hypothetical protein